MDKDPFFWYRGGYLSSEKFQGVSPEKVYCCLGVELRDHSLPREGGRGLACLFMYED